MLLCLFFFLLFIGSDLSCKIWLAAGDVRLQINRPHNNTSWHAESPSVRPSVRAGLFKYFSPSILFGENNELWLIVCLDNSVSYRFFLLLFYLSIKKTMAKMCLDNDPVACSIIIESHSNGWSIGKLTFLNCVINPNQPGTAAACRHDVVSLMHFSIIRFSSAVIQGRQTE